MELADLIIVNKADGELLPAARRACSDLRKAVHLLRPKRAGWEVEVRTGSALTGDGVPELWESTVDFNARLRETGELRSEGRRGGKEGVRTGRLGGGANHE